MYKTYSQYNTSNNVYPQAIDERNAYPQAGYPVSNYPQYNYNNGKLNDERIGFIGPFLLGGLTGGLVAPYFYRPYYNNYPPYYGPVMPRRW